MIAKKRVFRQSVAGVLRTASTAWVLTLLAGTGLTAQASGVLFGPFPLGYLPNGLPDPAYSRQVGPAISQERALQDIRSDDHANRILSEPTHQLILSQDVSGAGGTRTLKFQDYYKGLEVIGGMSLHHTTPVGIQTSDFLKSFDLDVTPRLSPEEAASVALAVGTSSGSSQSLKSQPALKVLPANGADTAKLVYWVTIKPEGGSPGSDIIVDAHTGELVAHLSHREAVDPVFSRSRKKPKPVTPKPVPVPIHTGPIAPIEVYQATSACQTFDFQGDLANFSPTQCTHVITQSAASTRADASALRAASNANQVLTYYLNIHGRSSFDNQGASSVSVVHIGRKFDNAFWDSDLKVMAYGDGDGTEFGDFTKGVDVAGHEMTHGVVSQTAKLLGYGDSGALNEAYADFFGRMVANDGQWVMGTQLYLHPTSASGIRDLADPGNLTYTVGTSTKKYPSTMAEKLPVGTQCDPGTNDSCWVHINATIPGHASYLVVQAIGQAKAEQIYYLALTQYLTATMDFHGARDQTVKACQALYPTATCQEVVAAFAQVGL